MVATETVDVVVVGARCAGTAAATALARAGRRVVAVDAARFPSSTISTHLLWAGGVAELQRMGALARVEECDAPRLPIGYAVVPGAPPVRATYTPVDDIDYGLCVRRRTLDAALVATARAAGAEIREQTRVDELLRDADGRVVGVVARPRGGDAYELRSHLVVGADGRRSTVARLVGAEQPHTWNANERACYYAYYTDPEPGWRSIAAQWREGADLGTAFPCDGGLTLVLLMPPLVRVPAFDADRELGFDRTVASIPGLADRLAGCARVGRIFGASELASYFRSSTGPGWALVGDAGHFKDPITAQGIRDAVRFGRLLGEQTAAPLDHPTRLDHDLAGWEQQRDLECRETYEWTNHVARAEPVGPLDIALHTHFAQPEHAHKLLDLHSRILRPSDVLPDLLSGEPSEVVPHEFLSDEWFAAVEGLGPPPPAPDEVHDAGAINLVVTRPDAADVAIHLSEGTLGRGLADEPSVTLRTTFEVAKTVFLTGDQHTAMSAFISGQVRVQGDLTRLIAMGRTVPSPAQRAYAKSVVRLTSP